MRPAERPVIAACLRTPIGKFQGALKDLESPRLGSLVIREALKRAGAEARDVDDVIAGCVLQAGLGQNPARQAAIGAGIPVEVPAATVNQVCGSSLRAVMLAAQSIRTGDAGLVVAAGFESMTRAPYLLPKAREGLRMGDATLVDSMAHDGLWDVYNSIPMGITGEIVAERHRVSRAEADHFAYESHRKAAAADREGRFAKEILPVEVPDGKGGKTQFAHDEGIRRDASLEAMGRLKPTFKESGVVTAGNSSQISDGASAVVVASRARADDLGLPVLAEIVSYDVAGVKPEWVMEAPIPSVRRLLLRSKMTIEDIDLFEHNEAFATASCAVRTALEVPEDRFNVHGGAVALGHPIGASGARVLTTLVHALYAHRKHRGLATLCLGGGNAVSMIVEVPK